MSTKQAFSGALDKIIEKISQIALQINDLTNLEMILQFAVAETRLLLQTDRAMVYRFGSYGDGVVFAESVGAEWLPIQGQHIYDPCFEATWVERYSQGQTSAISDIHYGHVPACYVEFLDRIQVKANLIVPILLSSKQQRSPKLWGLLIAHQCQSPRQWESLDVHLLQQVALQLGLRIGNLESDCQVLLQNQAPELQTEHPETGNKTESPISVNHQNCLQPDFAYSPSGDIFHLSAFDLLQNPIWVFDIEKLQMRWANQTSLHLWNASTRQQLISRNFSDMSESSLIRLRSYLHQFQQGKTCSEQWTFYPDGEPVSVYCRCSGIRIDNGRLAMLVEGMVETNDRIEPETLRSIEALRHTTLMVSLYTLEGLPLLQNPAALNCYGDMQHPDSGTDNVFLSHFVDSGLGIRAMAVAKSREVFSIEAQVITLAGIRWHGMDVRCIIDPVTGNPTLLVNEKDITHRVQVEIELREMSIALANAVEGISRLDIFGRYITANQAYANIAGYQPEEMVGMDWQKTVHPEDRDMMMAAYQQMLALGRVEVEARGIRKDGSIFYKQLVMLTAYDSQERAIGHHCFMKDISDRKQAEAALQQELDRLSIVIATQQEIAIRNPNLDAVMAVIAERTQHLTRADGAVIEMLEGDELVYRVASGIATAYVGLRIELGTSLSGQCMMTGSILLCHDSETDARVDLSVCQRIGVRSMVVVPLFYQEEGVGVLKVVSATPSAFKESDIQSLQLMAGFLAGSVHLASEFDAKNILLSQLQESEERYRSVIATMTEGVVLQLANGQITACNASAERIIGLTPEQMMGRTSVDLDWRTVQEDGSPFPGEQHPAMITLRTGKPQSNVVMGIHKSDKTLTWISINSQPLFHLHQSQPYAVVTSFADITERKQVEEMLINQAQRDRLIATTDGLTQVANRRCFDRRLQSEWPTLIEGQKLLSLIMLDVDYFKRYNDCYGHQAGDSCLVKVASSAALAVRRSSDLFARYGGEEFAVILPHTDAAGAIAVAESIQKAIRDLGIPHQQSEVSEIVTVSMGIATVIPSFGSSPDELVALADRALYDAKQQGRDRINCAVNQVTGKIGNKDRSHPI
ncbi:MAG: diguanylate cyclase domain-containing protein [Microcoleus sp.]